MNMQDSANVEVLSEGRIRVVLRDAAVADLFRQAFDRSAVDAQSAVMTRTVTVEIVIGS